MATHCRDSHSAQSLLFYPDMHWLRWTSLVGTLSCLLGCLGDPAGLSRTLLLQRLSPLDSVLVGAPGRALSTPIVFQVLDAGGQPIPPAVVEWSVSGTNGRVESAAVMSDAAGRIRAVWVLGTVASDPQTLTLRVQDGRHAVSDTVSATAKPVEVKSVEFRDADTVLVQLGIGLQITAQATDPFGNQFVPGSIRYVSLDTSLISIDNAGWVQARVRGYGRVAVQAGPSADTAIVHVTQFVRAIVPAQDTITFWSVGQIASLDVTLVDDHGLHILDSLPAVQVADTSVAEWLDSVTVRARGNGVTMANLTVGELSKQVVIIVEQVPKTLTARLTGSSPMVKLPIGATLPLECQAQDANGYPLAQEPTFVGSARATVTGTSCSDVRVQRPGYDTLRFAFGSLQAALPVIIAAAPDSVGVLSSAQPLTTVQRDSFVGEDLGNPLILALRPLAADIFAAYGNPITNLDRARAIRDWVARTAIYPDPAVHPDTSTSNLSVLPPGKTWADVNRVLTSAKWDSDATFWSQQFYDGYVMLDRLLGTLDPATGIRADDGMMEHVAGARYRIRDIQSYRYPLCTYEAIIATALWAAAGLQSMRVSTLDHDPAAVFIPELNRWVYEDPTFDEEYQLDGVGEPLSAADLLAVSTAGQAGRLLATKSVGPIFDASVYIEGRTYMSAGHPDGMVIMGSQLYQRVVGAYGTWTGRYVQIDVPRLAEESPFNNTLVYDPVTAGVAFPSLSPVVQDLHVEDSVYVVQLSTTFPNHERFERRLSGGTWGTVQATDVLPVGQCRVEYRSVDAAGNTSASAVLDLWVPRAPGFLESGAPGATRNRAQYCS